MQGSSSVGFRILPPATTRERLDQLRAVRALRQEGWEVGSFAKVFWTMAVGLGYNDAALKDFFNFCLDDPLPQCEMEGLRILDFWRFAAYLRHRRERTSPSQPGSVHAPAQESVSEGTGEAVTELPALPDTATEAVTELPALPDTATKHPWPALPPPPSKPSALLPPPRPFEPSRSAWFVPPAPPWQSARTPSSPSATLVTGQNPDPTRVSMDCSPGSPLAFLTSTWMARLLDRTTRASLRSPRVPPMTLSPVHHCSFLGPLLIDTDHCRPGTPHKSCSLGDALTQSSSHHNLVLVKLAQILTLAHFSCF
ncbi:hypothetical protein DPX16_7144 [Anabarilius grahami]|uniref:Uncharacterized protein n=1 Tax=Anabarilius grahami TaxID=495550 RepID=A0A3N0XH55_ANAGA|nr:hypothetical protein DPX16_7144 [Anabarilius grahami]